MLHVHPVPAFQDNYIWVIHSDDRHCAVVDPGEAAPVARFIEDQGLTLEAILLTHHHFDHINGVAGLLAHYPGVVYGPADERLPPGTRTLTDGECVDLPLLRLKFQVISVPGHTRSHIAYYGHGALFCGDTLFSLGCGRLFEGTPAQMLHSLDRLAQLPLTTQVYPAHEYTQANCRFARQVDPENTALADRAVEIAALRGADKPSLPAILGTEIACNPFLRSRAPAIIAAANRYAPDTGSDPTCVFASLRNWKDRF